MFGRAERGGPLVAGVVLGIALLAAAITFAADALYVPALALLLAPAGAAAWCWLGLRGARIARAAPGGHAVEGEPVDASVDVRFALPALPGTVLDDPLADGPVVLPAGRRATRVELTVRFPRRGRQLLAPPRIELSDPLGLWRAVRTPPGGAPSLLVLPRVERVRGPRGDEPAALSALRPSAVGAAETEFDGLRPLRSGAPASRIHWPALARGAGLLERRMVPEAQSRPLVVLDARGPVDEDDLDAAVRAVASLAVHLARRGGCAVLLPGDRASTALDGTLRRWPALHARLALVGPGGGPASAAIGQRHGALVWVAARPLERIPRGLSRAPADRRALVVPGALPGRRASFHVAGCAGYLVAGDQVGEAA